MSARSGSRSLSFLLGIVIFAQLSAISPAREGFGKSRESFAYQKNVSGKSAKATDWSVSMVESTMKRFPTCPYRKYHPAFKSLHLELRLKVRCSCS